MKTKSSNRVNIYLQSEVKELIQPIAENLHKRGVGGVINLDGSANQSAVITYLIQEKTKEFRKSRIGC